VTGGRALGDEGDRRRGGGPVREPCRGPRPAGLQGRRPRRFARRTRASNAAQLGTPRRKTALPGRSPAGEWMICASGGIAQTSRTSSGTATAPGLGHPRPSTSRTTSRTRLPERHLASTPTLDLRPQPEAGPSAAKVQDRPRHVLITAHVQAHRVAVGEPEDPRDLMRVNEVVQGYATGHGASLAALPDALSTRVINTVRAGM
jgi:hypothetical protein